jgi:hypothetical protein
LAYIGELFIEESTEQTLGLLFNSL